MTVGLGNGSSLWGEVPPKWRRPAFVEVRRLGQPDISGA